MLSKPLIENSYFVLSLSKISRGYGYIEERLDRIYKNSQTYRLMKRLWMGTKINFRYSFLRGLAEIRERKDSVILNNSRSFKCLVNVYEILHDRIVRWLSTSMVINLWKDSKKYVYLLSIKSVGIIIISTVLINIFFSKLLNKEIEWLGWVIRYAFLFVGIGGLFCNTPIEEIRKASFILRQIDKYCKI